MKVKVFSGSSPAKTQARKMFFLYADPVISEYLSKVKLFSRTPASAQSVFLVPDPVISEYLSKVKLFSRTSAMGNSVTVQGS